MSARVDETGRLSFGSLLSFLPPDVRSLTRKTEKTAQKVINRSYGVVFIETCINENLQPSFIDIEPYDPAANEQEYNSHSRKEILERELENQRNQL